MKTSIRHTTIWKLLVFGCGASVLTMLPPGSVAALPALLGDAPDVGRLGLAITLLGLVPWLLHLGGDRHTGHVRSAGDRGCDPTADVRLPHAARSIIAGMRRKLDPLVATSSASGPASEAAFTIAEMRLRYLPATIDAYLAIPASLRAQSAPHFLAQLRLLDAAVDDLARKLATDCTVRLDVNGRFLEARFASALSVTARR